MNDVNGVLIINKMNGMTSHDVVAEVRRMMHIKKAGHTGTLDPDATGVLPICVGTATKIAGFLMSSEKEYMATMILGIRTDTQDSAGKIVSRVKKVNVKEQKVRETFSNFKGEIEQIPPMVSAVRYKGKKLYELARQGKEVERIPRKVNIFELEILSCMIPKVTFRVVCSKGTYIRTLTSDIGDILGCGAHQAGLVRLRSGPFRLSEAITLEDLKKMQHPEERIIPVEAALSHLPSVKVRDWFGDLLRKNALITETDTVDFPQVGHGETVRIENCREELIAIGMAEKTAGSGNVAVRVMHPLKRED